MGRLPALYHLSPWEHSYSQIHDAYSPYAWYTGRTMYGPVLVLILMMGGPARWCRGRHHAAEARGARLPSRDGRLPGAASCRRWIDIDNACGCTRSTPCR